MSRPPRPTNEIVLPNIASEARIFDGTNKCFIAFERLIAGGKNTIARDLNGRMAIWDKYAGARAKPGYRLDNRLQGRDTIVDTFVSLLDVIASLSSVAYDEGGAEPISGELLSRLQNEAGETLGQDSIMKASEQMATRPWGELIGVISELLSLTRTVRESSILNRPSSVPAHYQRKDSGFFEHTCRLLGARFPDARSTLTDQLGKSIAVRRNRLLYRRDHEKSMQQTDNDSADVSESKTAGSVFGRSSRVEDVQIVYPDKPTPDIHDKSYGCCPYCFVPQSLPITGEEWRAHVDKDLQVYICLSEQCADPIKFFDSSDAWLSHTNQEHGREWAQNVHLGLWYCDLGHDDRTEELLFQNVVEFETHLSEVHKAERRKIDMYRRRKRRRGEMRESDVCPLCEKQPTISSQKADSLSGSQLPEHIAAHLRVLAMLSIPALDKDPEYYTNDAATLDKTYERMLIGIDKTLRLDALTLLRWLAYAKSPLSLGQLVDALVIDLDADGSVKVNDRPDLLYPLDILSGLVTIGWPGEVRRTGKDTRVRLADSSLKDYLESKRVLKSQAKEFYLESGRAHKFIAQSCLTYLMHYSGSSAKTSTLEDLALFPLLGYAASSWYYHSSLQQSREVGREVFFLTSEKIRGDWLLVHQPDWTYWKRPFERELIDTGSGLYYASTVGLEVVVSALIDAGADVNAQGGWYRNALQTASVRGHEKVVQILIDAGADVNAQGVWYDNAQGVWYDNALQAASDEGHEKVVQMLIDAKADVNAQVEGGLFSNALQAASARGHEKIVQMLIDAKADVNAQGGEYNNALQAASAGGHEKIVQMLIGAKADVNAQGGWDSNALQAASNRGHEKVVQILIDAGADVNAHGRGYYSNALQAVSARGHEKIVQLLLDGGVDVNVQGGYDGNALQAASGIGSEEVVQLLLNHGANVNAQGGEYGNALQAASYGGYQKVVQLLLENGANINAQGGKYGNALQAAFEMGHKKVEQLLLENGAEKAIT